MMSCDKPKISIVTPSYNQGQFIEQTIDSILSQNYSNLEYIIIDGGSTDDTVEIIRKYEKHLKYWVSEKDEGQSDAINKGLTHCTGQIFNWINSDDYLEPDSLKHIANTFKLNKYDAFAASVTNVDPIGNFLHITQNNNLTPRNLLRWRGGISFHQPGVWLKNELVQKCGPLLIDYHYSFDVIFLANYFSKFHKVQYSERPIINFRLHEESKTVSEQDKFRLDLLRYSKAPKHPSLKKHINNRLLDEEWDAFKNSFLNDMNVLKKINQLFKYLCFYPQITWDRKTLGFLRKII